MVFRFLSLTIGLFFLAACSTSAPTVRSPITFDSLIAETDKPMYFQKSCRYFSTDLKVLRALPGQYCAETENGIAIADSNGIVSMGSNLKPRWRVKKFYTHHQLNESEVGTELLALNSVYSPGGRARDLTPIRHDRLTVLNKRGKIIKNFNIEKYITEKSDIQIRKNDWTADQFNKNSFEATHINSFRELFSEADGVRTLTGYVTYDLQHEKVIILDAGLKNVVRAIDFHGRVIHDVRQYGENVLIYFLNENIEEPMPRQSKIETYNLLTNEFKTLYQSENVKIVYSNCGAVVPIEKKYLFINYSRCKVDATNAPTTSYFEMVNLATQQSVLAQSEKEIFGTGVSVVRQLPNFVF